MRGENRCTKSPDEGDTEEHPYCCIHPRRRKRDCICCWCGLLFEEDPVARGRHGQYRPSAERLRAKVPAMATGYIGSGRQPK